MIQNHLLHDHGQTIEQELEHMPSVENFQTVADIFKQLGDGSRIQPLPVAAVVLPSASSASVRSRTSSPSPLISALPPALSATSMSAHRILGLYSVPRVWLFAN